MVKLAWLAVALSCFATAGCGEQARAPDATPQGPSAAVERWEPGEDLAGTQVVVGGVVQEVPPEVADAKRKLDDVAAGYSTEMDELERKRLQRFSGDTGAQPDAPEIQ